MSAHDIHDNTPLLTLGDVRQLVREIRTVEQELTSLQSALNAKREHLERIRTLVPPQTMQAIETQELAIAALDLASEDEPNPRGRFSDEVVRLLQEKRGALSTGQIREAMTERGFGAQMSGSRNYIYTTLGRLVERGRLKKDGDVYSLPS